MEETENEETATRPLFLLLVRWARETLRKGERRGDCRGRGGALGWTGPHTRAGGRRRGGSGGGGAAAAGGGARERGASARARNGPLLSGRRAPLLGRARVSDTVARANHHTTALQRGRYFHPPPKKDARDVFDLCPFFGFLVAPLAPPRKEETPTKNGSSNNGRRRCRAQEEGRGQEGPGHVLSLCPRARGARERARARGVRAP